MNGTEYCMKQPSCHECGTKCKEYKKVHHYTKQSNNKKKSKAIKNG